METLEKWEYVTRPIGPDHDWLRVEAVLNDLGDAGWELVAVTGNNTHRAFLKRRVERGP
jgi:phosphoglycolate phosphatase-like HAD superfamily hydrolase